MEHLALVVLGLVDLLVGGCIEVLVTFGVF